MNLSASRQPRSASAWSAASFTAGFDEDHTPLLNHAMHWGYGTGWGAAYALR